MGQRWSREELQKVAQYRREGKHLSEIAELLPGRTRVSVMNICSKYNIPLKGNVNIKDLFDLENKKHENLKIKRNTELTKAGSTIEIKVRRTKEEKNKARVVKGRVIKKYPKFILMQLKNYVECFRYDDYEIIKECLYEKDVRVS